MKKIYILLIGILFCSLSKAQNNATRNAFNTNVILNAPLGVNIGAGTTTVPPLKLTSQPSGLTVVQQGAFELIGNRLHFTNLAVRRTIMQAEEVVIADIPIVNTATETTIHSVPHGANYLEVGKMEKIELQGTITSISGAGTNTLTIRFKYAGTTYATYVIAEAARTTQNIELHAMITCRAIGAGTTSIQIHCRSEIDSEANDATFNGLATGLDSTTSQPFTITAQWSDASTGNALTILQGSTICIDDNN